MYRLYKRTLSKQIFISNYQSGNILDFCLLQKMKEFCIITFTFSFVVVFVVFIAAAAAAAAAAATATLDSWMIRS
jgi:hypothetical protein